MEKFESAGISYFNESNEVKFAQIDQMKMKINEREVKEEQKIELESSLED